MVRFTVLFLTILSLAVVCLAEDNKEANSSCTFGNGQQVSVRYSPVSYDKNSELPSGQAWNPGGQPIYLFSQAPLKLSNTALPPGAYRLVIIPGKETWEIALNRNVQQDAKYDASQNVGKISAQTGKLPSPANRLTLYFGRLTPETCTLRIDYGQQRAFTDFVQQTK
jgi:hypothetical protein